MLTSRATRRVEIEHEPGNFATIRPLTWKEREAAKQEAMRIALAQFAGMDDTLESITRLFGRDERDAVESTDPLDGFYIAAVLHDGLEKLEGPLYESPGPLDDEMIDDLDHTTAEVIARHIITASQRSASEGEASGSATPGS